MIQFSEQYTSYPDGQQNTGQPPDAVLARGFVPATAGARGQPLPAQWLNWLFQKLFRLANRDKIGRADGTKLFDIPESCIRLEAFDRQDPNKYIIAIGYKGASNTVHALKVVSSGTLTLGTPLADGTQPVLGGSTDVVVCAYSRNSGDM